MKKDKPWVLESKDKKLGTLTEGEYTSRTKALAGLTYKFLSGVFKFKVVTDDGKTYQIRKNAVKVEDKNG